jgi:hypothetical protein
MMVDTLLDHVLSEYDPTSHTSLIVQITRFLFSHRYDVCG